MGWWWGERYRLNFASIWTRVETHKPQTLYAASITASQQPPQFVCCSHFCWDCCCSGYCGHSDHEMWEEITDSWPKRMTKQTKTQTQKKNTHDLPDTGTAYKHKVRNQEGDAANDEKWQLSPDVITIFVTVITIYMYSHHHHSCYALCTLTWKMTRVCILLTTSTGIWKQVPVMHTQARYITQK